MINTDVQVSNAKLKEWLLYKNFHLLKNSSQKRLIDHYLAVYYYNQESLLTYIARNPNLNLKKLKQNELNHSFPKFSWGHNRKIFVSPRFKTDLVESQQSCLIKPNHQWINDILKTNDNSSLSLLDKQKQITYWYVKSYGPITINDLSWWLGTNKSKSKELLTQTGLVSVGKYWFENGNYKLFNSFLDRYKIPQTQVKFLPAYDPLINGYASNSEVQNWLRSNQNLNDASKKHHSIILFNGSFNGTWQMNDKTAEFIINPISKIQETNQIIIRNAQKMVNKINYELNDSFNLKII